MDPNAALLVLLISASVLSKGQSTSKSVDAYARYSGADSMLNNYSRSWQNEIPKNAQFYVGGAFYVGNAISERRVTVTWTFP
jgi:hypothetical protein